MKDEQTRYKHYMPEHCMTGAKAGMQTIVVRQVLGEREKQKVLDIHVRVPERKPAIEQIIDVFVKHLEVNAVDVITDRVIVRGEFEIKAIYVACLPGNPVHAVEIKHCKWTQDIDICGARPGMDADANVMVEFVDYDVAEMTRAYKYKYHGKYDPCDTTCSCDSDPCNTKDTVECCPPHKPMPPFKPPMGPPCDGMPPFKPPMGPPCDGMPPFKPPMGPPCDGMPPFKPPMGPPCDGMPPFKPPMGPPCNEMPPCNDMPMCPPMHPIAPPCPPTSCEEICCRDFDVSVILKITAKVLADREVHMNSKPMGNQSGLPEKPKG